MKTKSKAEKWTYRGVDIVFDGHRTVPEFQAEVAGNTIRGPSLDSVKKKIDVASKFEAFDAYVTMSTYQRGRRPAAATHGNKCLMKVRVVGINKGGIHTRVTFALADGEYADAVIPATDAALKAWLAAQQIEEQTNAKIEELRKIAADAAAKVPVKTAREMAS